MALKAKGAAALDCFEVTLKCEAGYDDDEAVEVAVIPRPEPMLRGEGGDTSLPLGGPGLDLQVPVPGSRSPGASLGRHLQPQRALPCPVRGYGALAPPPPGLESQASRSPPSSAAPHPLRV